MYWTDNDFAIHIVQEPNRNVQINPRIATILVCDQNALKLRLQILLGYFKYDL